MDASQDWIDVLRVAVKRSSSRQVARQLGVSVSSVSMALSATAYPVSAKRLRARVREVLMSEAMRQVRTSKAVVRVESASSSSTRTPGSRPEALCAMGASQDWIDVLRAAVKRSSMRQVARQLDVSLSSVSMVLAGTYVGNAQRLQQRVIDRLMSQCMRVEGAWLILPASKELPRQLSILLSSARVYMNLRVADKYVSNSSAGRVACWIARDTPLEQAPRLHLCIGTASFQIDESEAEFLSQHGVRIVDLRGDQPRCTG